MRSKNKIVELKNKLKTENLSGLALDIDETLSWTIWYWVNEMQTIFGNPENLTIEELIKKYRYTQNVPYWQTKEAFEWMEEKRNSDELQEKLPLIENADKIVQKINKIIPVVAYITTRPEAVIKGTNKWLKKHKFPEAEIIARPNSVPSEMGNSWKAGILKELYPEVRGIIDDNPGLVEHLPDNYKGVIFLYDNLTTVDTQINVVPCLKWKDVYKCILSEFKIK